MSDEAKICGVDQNTFVKWMNGIVGVLMMTVGIANVITLQISVGDTVFIGLMFAVY
jgi:ABC-type bacteriocin/lantibiotic exporter with double-glycine peptidase domain